MVSHHALSVFNAEFAFRLHKDCKFSAVINRLNHRRIKELLNLPDARVIVNTVALVIAGVSGCKIKGTFGRIIETVLFSELNQCRACELILSFGIIEAQTALIAGSKVNIIRDALSKPLMASTGFEIPDFFVVAEADTEAFAGAVSFDNLAEELYALDRKSTRLNSSH